MTLKFQLLTILIPNAHEKCDVDVGGKNITAIAVMKK